MSGTNTTSSDIDTTVLDVNATMLDTFTSSTTSSTTFRTTTSTSTTSTTTTAPSCTATPTASLVTKTSATAWALYAYNYTAVSTMPVLISGFTTATNACIYLDSVSVVDNSASSIQLLNNPGFDNSTTNLTGWSTWCTSSCGVGFPGRVLTNTSCYAGSCYFNHCRSTAYDYLYQPFPTTIGHTYTIPFCATLTGFGIMRFTANVQN